MNTTDTAPASLAAAPCSAVRNVLDALCRKTERGEFFHIWRDEPIHCGPLTTEVAKAAGIPLQTARRCLHKLERDGHANSRPTPGGITRWWCPPNDKLSHGGDNEQ